MFGWLKNSQTKYKKDGDSDGYRLFSLQKFSSITS